MSFAVTVLVDIERWEPGLVDLVRSLDAQTMAAADFEVVLVHDAASTDPSAELADRLEEVARHRPNVVVSAAGTSPALAAANGIWLLHLDRGAAARGTRLRSEALVRLVDFATRHDCDLTLGRIDVAAGTVANDLFTADRAPAAVPAEACTDAIVLSRREFAIAHGLASDAKDWAAILPAAGRVGVLGSYQCLTQSGETSASSDLVLSGSTACWHDGCLEITVTGSAAHGAAGQQVLLSIRSAGRGIDYWLDSDGTVGADGSFVATGRADPRTAALGSALSDGAWVVWAGAHGRDHHRSPRRPVPATEVPGAVLDGLLVAAVRQTPALTVDIGSTRASVVPRLTSDDVTIEDGASGTKLIAVLPGLEVCGTTRAKGQLRLAGFPLVAALIAEDGTARIECFLSGLPGRTRISTRFGRVSKPTGLDLVIAPTGGMTVRPSARKPRPPAPPTALPSNSPHGRARRVYRRLMSGPPG